MIESNIISKILKKNINHKYNYLINKKYNVIVKTIMNKIVGFPKKNYIYLVNGKNLNNHLTNNLDTIRKDILTYLTNKVEREFV